MTLSLTNGCCKTSELAEYAVADGGVDVLGEGAREAPLGPFEAGGAD
jgi:hypothetical protein